MKAVCFPFGCGHEETRAQRTGYKGMLMGEVSRLFRTIDTLEKQGQKEREGKPPSGKGADAASVDGSAAASKPSALRKAGLNRSYKQMKRMLLRRSDSSPDVASEANVSQAASDLPHREGSLSANSLDSVVSIDSAALRSKLLKPVHERLRQDTVDALNIVQGSQSDPHYQNIIALAAKIFKVPYASIAIMDRGRVWMKAIHSRSLKVWEEPRELSFVSYMLLSEKREVMVVEDTKEDVRFHDLVRNVPKDRPRFFAAAPMYSSNGYQMGALTITDTKPRKLDAGSFALLTNLAEMAMRALEKEAFGRFTDPEHLPPAASGAEKLLQAPGAVSVNDSALDVNLIPDLADNRLARVPSAKRSPREKLTLVRSKNMLQTGIMVCDTAGAGGAGVLFVNSIWSQLTGVSAQSATSKTLWQLFSVPGKDVGAMNKQLQEAFTNQTSLDVCAKLQGAADRTFCLTLKSACSDNLDPDMPLVGVPSFVEFSQKRNQSYFFVMVRAASDLVAQPPGPKLVRSVFAQLSETSWTTGKDEAAAAAAAGAAVGEPGGGLLDMIASSQGLGRNASHLHRKQSVPLPYNDELFSAVKLGPLLGRGSFGKVHRGIWQEKQIAVKILETFRRGPVGEEVEDLPEAALMASMRHPNLMHTFAHATRVKRQPGRAGPAWASNDNASDGHILETWLLLEYCNKGSLQDATDRGWFRTEPSKAKGKPDLGIILATALELASGLEHLHAQGVLHGDLSPGNVLLADCPEAPHGFTVKVADFGLSRATSSKTIKTQTYGTVTHMPPELLMDGKLTTAADVYAFGVLLWGMFTGTPAWQGMRRAQVLFKVTALGAKLPKPQGCPGFFADMLERCMLREHKDRPSFPELRQELAALNKALQSGLDLESAVSVRQNGRRCISMPKAGAAGAAAAEIQPAAAQVVRKTASFPRRPSFSVRTQLEVV